MNTKVLIAEDDVLIAETLKSYLIEFGYTVSEVVSSLEEFKQEIEQDVDFCFLDIRMHGKDLGFELAEYLNEHSSIPFMFLTSFSDVETIQEASKYQPVGYLTKPFKKADIFSAIEIAKMNSNKQNEKIEFKDGVSTVFIEVDDIYYLKSDNIYVEVHHKGGRILERISLDKIVHRLPTTFKRSHRSYIVNSKLIQELKSTELKIANQTIPISRTYKSNFK